MNPRNDLIDPNLEPHKQGKHRPAASDALAESPGVPYATRLMAARAGSQTARDALFEECRNYLLLIATRQLGDSIRAKFGANDLVQETLVQGHRIFERFNGSSRAELAAWLAQILHFKLAQSTGRFVGPTQAGGLGGSAARPGESLRREQQALRQVLDRLPREERLAIELRGLERRSFDDLGNALGQTADAAQRTWARAMLRLHREWAGDRSSASDPSAQDTGKP